MLVVLLLPVVLLLAACLLDQLERHMVSQPPGAHVPTAHVPTDGPVAEVVPLRSGPELDDATLRLRRAS